jgi:hypothetical protein
VFVYVLYGLSYDNSVEGGIVVLVVVVVVVVIVISVMMITMSIFIMSSLSKDLRSYRSLNDWPDIK